MELPAPLLLALAALATFRLTRLVVADQFPPIRWGRERVEDKAPEWLVDLSTCRWCASGWVSAGIVALLWLAPGVAALALTWAGLWGAGALIADWQARAEREPEPLPLIETDEDGMVTMQMQVGANGRAEV
jgi:hypothetical protein